MTCADSGSELPLGEPHNVTGNKQARTNRPIGEIPKSTGLVSAQLIDSAMTDFTASGFQVDRALVHRFVASLLTKRFVILTGLSGSGKTKLAQALAAWMTSTSVQEDVWQQRTPESSKSIDEWLPVGAELTSGRTFYRVDAVDSLAVQFSNERGNDSQRVKVTLPRELIEEWVNCIKGNDFSRETTARVIREQVATTTKYSTQLNSFETHLKAAAFALIEQEEEQRFSPEQEHVNEPEHGYPQENPPENANPNEVVPAAYEIVAVGADWSTNEHILGYADALHTTQYARTQALNLILRAHSNRDLPYFLILDEMNLSHVERYFADVLSSIESGEPIHLYGAPGDDSSAMRDGVPQTIQLPENLFIIGTVNVDETTYMFSPKVLDRANTIEFRIDELQLETFLENPTGVSLAGLRGKGNHYAKAFLNASLDSQAQSSSEVQAHINGELKLIFNVMAHHGYEFGFRTALEISRFISKHQQLGEEDWEIQVAIDAQIYQKILPRLNGSRARLEPVLRSLAVLCRSERKWSSSQTGPTKLENRESILIEARAAASSLRLQTASDPFSDPSGQDLTPIYPLSDAKIQRMYWLVRQNGFTSFAEA